MTDTNQGALEQRIETLEKELTEIKDREAIREVIHRYCHAVDRCDLEELKGCYHADGYDDHGFFAGNAHEFADYVIPVLEQIDSSCHSISNTRIKIKGNQAACGSYWSVIHRLRHEAGFADFWHQGRYLDVFEKRGGEWKILHRVIVGDFDRWIETIDLRAQMEDSPNATLAGCRGDKDPGNLWFDLTQHRPDRTAMEDLWGVFHALSDATRPN